MITASGWCRCGHESAVHRFGKDDCVANICECAKFEQAGPPGNTGPPPIVFRPAGDFHEDDEPVSKIVAAFEAGEKGVTGPSDLAHAIQAAFKALDAMMPDVFSPHDGARIAVEAAWKVWSGEV